MGTNPTESDDDTPVLDGPVRVIELGPYDAQVFPLQAAQQVRNRIRLPDFGIIVQKQEVVPPGLFYAEIVDGRVIELALEVYDPDRRILLQAVIVGKGLVLGAVVLDDDDLYMLIGILLKEGADALVQVVRVVLVRDKKGNQRESLNLKEAVVD